MKKIKQVFSKLCQYVIDKVMGNGLMQEENSASGEKYITPEMPEYLRSCGEEGIVLLKNDGVLPLREKEEVAVFGRCQFDWFYVGYGSGGDIHPPYKISLLEGFANQGIVYNQKVAEKYYEWCNQPENKADHGWWGHWPFYHPEMPLDEKYVESISKENKIALVVIGRAAGEERDNQLKPGSYYLTDLEKNMLNLVSKYFENVVVIMNCGSIIDMSWIKDYKISGLLYAWQLGQESGNALANVLIGKVSPSGKLADSIANSYEEYPSSKNFGRKDKTIYKEGIFVGYRYFFGKPEAILFPFGYGLTYSDFSIEILSFERFEDEDNFQNDNEEKNQFGKVFIKAKVTNIGKNSGKEVLQIYERYEGSLEEKLSIPSENLVAYKKTKLLAPNEFEIIEFEIEDKNFASFDENGILGYKSSFVLPKGYFNFYAGFDSTATLKAGNISLEKTKLVEKCELVCLPGKKGSELVKSRILKNLPKEIPQDKNKGILFSHVKEGKNTLEEFIAQLSDKELCDLTRGEGGMSSVFGVSGNAGMFGGITESLRKKGIIPVITADGPAGLRIRKYTSLLPCGTAIACTWNDELVEKLFTKLGEEVKHFGVNVILSPGMNIHRNPLCGRNFEYYSEDPLLTGKISAAAVRGIQKSGISACPKHFACNNQEFNRNQNDSQISNQALREIYLRAFEICVKEGKPLNIMTSYNKINGVWSHYNYDLVTTVLRNEWKYEGNVITDWWMRPGKSPEFPKVKNNGYRVRAQVDVLMPGSLSPVSRKYKFDKNLYSSIGKKDNLTRAELQRSAKNVLRFIMKI